ncbi:MAG: hypothetical protein MR487_12145 [Lachnospiraceae bacterium]|nr:hypothetical protein [Lachnospiraceae bacterium]
MSDRVSDSCSVSGVRKGRKRGHTSEDTLTFWKEAKKQYDEIEIPEELDGRVRKAIKKIGEKRKNRI